MATTRQKKNLRSRVKKDLVTPNEVHEIQQKSSVCKFDVARDVCHDEIGTILLVESNYEEGCVCLPPGFSQLHPFCIHIHTQQWAYKFVKMTVGCGQGTNIHIHKVCKAFSTV